MDDEDIFWLGVWLAIMLVMVGMLCGCSNSPTSGNHVSITVNILTP